MFRQLVVSTLVLSLVFVPSPLSSLPPTQSRLLPTLVLSNLLPTPSTSPSPHQTSSSSLSTSSSLITPSPFSSRIIATSTSVTLLTPKPARSFPARCDSDRNCSDYATDLCCVKGSCGGCATYEHEKPSSPTDPIPIVSGGTLASFLLVIIIAVVCHFQRKRSSTPPNTRDSATEGDVSFSRENPVQNINYPQYSNTAEGGVVLDLSLMAAMSQQPPPYKFRADPIPPPPPYDAIDNSNTNSGYS